MPAGDGKRAVAARAKKRNQIAIVIAGCVIAIGALIALLSYKAPLTEESVRREFTQIVESNLRHQNPAIAEMMAVTRMVINGEKIHFDDCPNVEMEVSITFADESGARLLGVDPGSVTADEKTVHAEFVYVVNVRKWGVWAEVRPLKIWHETYHLQQGCTQLQHIYDVSAETGFSFETFYASYWENAMNGYEAYATAVEGYWYHQNPRPYDLFQSGIEGYKVYDLWSYYFTTTEPRFWRPIGAMPTPDELKNAEVTFEEVGGLPLIEAHPNYREWNQFVLFWYNQ